MAQVLVNQRNNLANEVANHAADLLVAKARIAELEAEVRRLKPEA